MEIEGGAIPWSMVVVGGPIILGLILAFVAWRNAQRNRRVDPTTPGDDPSKGMPGHDVPPDAPRT